MTIAKIFKLLDSMFAFKDADEWDNSGFFNFDKDQVINKVLVSLDIDNFTIDKAIQNNIKLIISHHPVYIDINDLKTPHIKKLINKIQAYNITIISLHTNYDKSRYGMNYFLLKKLNLIQIKKHHKSDYLFIGKTKKKIRYQLFLEKLKKKFNLDFVIIDKNDARYVNDSYISTIGLVAGSGSNCIKEINLSDKVDLFITGEVKWHLWNFAKNRMITLIDAGHVLEKHFIESISTILNEQNIEVLKAYPENSLIIK